MEFPVKLELRGVGILTVTNETGYKKAKALGFSDPYVHQEFPKMKYGPKGANKTVNSAEEEAALGEDWHSNPVEGEHFNIA